MFGKLFESMYEGTLYGQWQGLVTFQQMIILSDADGIIDMTPPAIAARTGIPLDIIQKGIEVLEQADPYSRSSAHEGRRIVRLDPSRPWGWQVVNKTYYRKLASADEKREADRQRIAAKRATTRDGLRRDATNDLPKETCCVSEDESREVSREVADVAHADADADTDASKRARKRATRLPENFSPDLDYARITIPDIDAEAEAARFRDYWRSKAGSAGAKLEWPATWRNWIRNCRDSGRYTRVRVGAVVVPIMR